MEVTGQQVPGKFVQETHYLVYFPEGYNEDTSRRWPLVIFLHGSGESGNDLNKVKVHGPPKLAEKGKKFPFILVSPQAPPGMGWQTATLYQLLSHIKRTQRVDDKKVYLTGLSMGGYGTWEFAMEYPSEFAAIAPVCGGGDSSKAWRLRHIPIWNFHGAKDDVVFPEESDKMVAAARRHNSKVRYTLYPEANHNSWDSTYNKDSLYDWLLAQSKFEYKEINMAVSELKPLAGKYVRKAADTLAINLDDNKLNIIAGRDTFQLRPAAKNMFFIHPDWQLEIQFRREGGKVTGLLVLDNDQALYRKVK